MGGGVVVESRGREFDCIFLASESARRLFCKKTIYIYTHLWRGVGELIPGKRACAMQETREEMAPKKAGYCVKCKKHVPVNYFV